MAENREPSMAWHGFNLMRQDIVECREILERNEFLGVPTEPRVRRVAEMKIPTHEEMMEAAYADDRYALPEHTAPKRKGALQAALRYFSGPDPSASRRRLSRRPAPTYTR